MKNSAIDAPVMRLFFRCIQLLAANLREALEQPVYHRCRRRWNVKRLNKESDDCEKAAESRLEAN